MKKNNIMMLGNVEVITIEYCDLLEEGKHAVFNKEIDLLDNGELKNYTTIFCCKKGDEDIIKNEIESFRGKDKEEYKINGEVCHIATYQTTDDCFHISFDSNDKCSIHANYNEKFKCIEDFFIRYLNSRNSLIERKQIVKDDDSYQYFLSVVKGFNDNKANSFFNNIKQIIKRRK